MNIVNFYECVLLLPARHNGNFERLMDPMQERICFSSGGALFQEAGVKNLIFNRMSSNII